MTQSASDELKGGATPATIGWGIAIYTTMYVGTIIRETISLEGNECG